MVGCIVARPLQQMGVTEVSPATPRQDGCSWGAPVGPRARGGAFTTCVHPHPRAEMQMAAPWCWVLRLGAEQRVAGPGLKGHQQERAWWGDHDRTFSPALACNPSAAQGPGSGS